MHLGKKKIYLPQMVGDTTISDVIKWFVNTHSF